MSERVVPTEPGWWWVVYDGAACDETVVEVFDDECGGLRFRGPLVEGEPLVTARLWVWLEPVAPLGTAARLAEVEAEIAALKQRIAASPVAWVQFGNHNNPCEISEDRETFWAGEHPPGTLRKVRLLEVRDGE